MWIQMGWGGEGGEETLRLRREQREAISHQEEKKKRNRSDSRWFRKITQPKSALNLIRDRN